MLLSAMASSETIPFHRLSICQKPSSPNDSDEDRESFADSGSFFFEIESESENKSTASVLRRLSVPSRPRLNSMEALSDLSNIGFDGKKKSALCGNSGYGGSSSLRNCETSRSAELIRNRENDCAISNGVNLSALRKSENDRVLRSGLNNSGSSSYGENLSNLLNPGERLSSLGNGCSNCNLSNCEKHRDHLGEKELFNGEKQSFFSYGEKQNNGTIKTDFLYAETHRSNLSNTDLLNGEKQSYSSKGQNNSDFSNSEKLGSSSGYGEEGQDSDLINCQKQNNPINGHEKQSNSSSFKRLSNLSKLEIPDSSSCVENFIRTQKNKEKQRRSFGYGDSSYSATRSFNTRRSSAELEEASMAKASRSLSESRRPHRKNSLSVRESLLAEAWERKRELMLSEELANMKDRTMRPDLLGRSSSDLGKSEMMKKKVLNQAPSSPSSELRRSTTMTRSLTAADFEELKGCIDLGFHFDENSAPDLCETLPALGVFCAVNQSFQGSPSRATTPGAMSPVGLQSPARCSSPSTPSWRISSPGDDPKDVKGKLRHWAQAVACNARLCY